MAFHKILIALFLHRMSVLKLIAFARDVHDGMSADTTNFPTPDVTMAQLAADADALAQVEGDFKHDKSLKGARDAARTVLERDLNRLGQYVITVAEKVVPEKQPAILQSARFAQRKQTARDKAVFAIDDAGMPSGSVKAVFNRGKLAKKHQKLAIYLQLSVDGGLTWQDWNGGQGEFDASFAVSGLTPTKTYQFRYRAKVGKTMGDWSKEVVTHLVK